MLPGSCETPLDFVFLSASTATSDAAGDLLRWNPFLTRAEADSIVCCTLLLMMTTNRINHSILALQQGRSLFKLLKALQNPKIDAIQSERLKKEILSLGENLAATLGNKRQYAKEISSGVFEIDPRFLHFEFSHGLVLRLSQVHLVLRLMQDMAQHKSVCHQMIMGAGKTTVVGPLLAMLLANKSTLIFEVVPPALLDFSAGILRERFSAGIRKPVFTFSFDRYSTVTPMLLSKLQTVLTSLHNTNISCVIVFLSYSFRHVTYELW